MSEFFDIFEHSGKIGKYEIVSFVGRGSSGVVYKAFDPIIERYVALKIISGDAFQNSEIMKRFKKEVRAQGKVTHPNVAMIFDVVYIEGHYILVMEWIGGNTLRAILNQDGVLSLKRFYQAVSQICDGLSYAHKQGVIHRDIKPDNICVAEDWRIKIMDFSIAKIDTMPTVPGSFLIGTADYMSPEQILGKEIGPFTDQFSLGAVCYELLTGAPPFRGARIADTIMNITKYDPRDICEINPLVDAGLNAIIKQAMFKNSLQRFPSLRHFKRSLKEHMLCLEPAIADLDSEY